MPAAWEKACYTQRQCLDGFFRVMLFQRIDSSLAINTGNGGAAIEKGYNRARKAGHSQCTDADDAAAEKANEDAGTVAENAAPFIGEMAVAAMFQNPGNGVIGAQADIRAEIEGNAQTGCQNADDEKENTAP